MAHLRRGPGYFLHSYWVSRHLVLCSDSCWLKSTRLWECLGEGQATAVNNWLDLFYVWSYQCLWALLGGRRDPRRRREVAVEHLWVCVFKPYSYLTWRRRASYLGSLIFFGVAQNFRRCSLWWNESNLTRSRSQIARMDCIGRQLRASEWSKVSDAQGAPPLSFTIHHFQPVQRHARQIRCDYANP